LERDFFDMIARLDSGERARHYGLRSTAVPERPDVAFAYANGLHLYRTDERRQIPKGDMKANVSQFSCRSCGTLRSFDSIFQGQKIAASFHSSAPTGGDQTRFMIHAITVWQLMGGSALPMMAITLIA
jgi:hypothetical protein